MHADHHIKRFLFKSYAFISIAVFVAAMLAAVLLIAIHRKPEWQISTTIAGGAIALAFGVQKQNLEETKLFKELFEHVNDRYDKMNDDLNQIHQQLADLSLTEDEKRKLFKYINLCGEEYLYFEKEFICPEVWRAWQNGMKFFQKNSRIKDLWDKELKNNESYYGLKFR